MDEFTTMLSILNSKIQEQQVRIQEQQVRINNLVEDSFEASQRYSLLRDELDEKDETIRCLERVQSDLTYWRSQAQALQDQITAEAAKDPIKQGIATTFMQEKGEALLKDSKINCIKYVRELTGWGLKVSKDWVEAYADSLVRKPEYGG